MYNPAIEEDYLENMRKYDFKSKPYITAGDLRGMYSKAGLMDPADGASGGFYRKLGPDERAGYAPGTANSGTPMITQVFAQDYAIAASKAAEKYDKLIHAMDRSN